MIIGPFHGQRKTVPVSLTSCCPESKIDVVAFGVPTRMAAVSHHQPCQCQEILIRNESIVSVCSIKPDRRCQEEIPQTTCVSGEATNMSCNLMNRCGLGDLWRNFIIWFVVPFPLVSAWLAMFSTRRKNWSTVPDPVMAISRGSGRKLKMAPCMFSIVQISD